MSLQPVVASLLEELATVGIQRWVDEKGDQLRYRAPKGAMTDERLRMLRERRTLVLEHLRAEAEPPRLLHDGATRHDPFPVTDVQATYLLGRRNVFPYGGVGCHGYGELEFPELDPARLQVA